MKTDEKIRKYLEGEMTPEELSSFEKEMENFPGLKKTVENLKSTVTNYRDLSSSEPETNYFNNIIPEFRKSIEKRKKVRFSPAYAFGSLIVIISAAIILFFISKNELELQPDKDFTQSLKNEEIEQFLNDYSSDYSYMNFSNGLANDELLDSLLTSELNLSANNFDLQFDFANTDINRIIYNLSEEDFDGLYAELINISF